MLRSSGNAKAKPSSRLQSAGPLTNLPRRTPLKDLPLPPLSSTYSFYIHQPSFLSAELILYSSIDKALAYRVVTHSRRLLSKSPNVNIYRCPQKPNSLAGSSTSRQDNGVKPDETPLAAATVRRLTTTILLTINDRSFEVQRRLIGFYKYADAWQSSRGIMSWKHGRLLVGMQLFDEKGTLLGGFDPKTGKDGRVGRLWVQDVEEEAVNHWVDEAVSITLAVLIGLTSRG
ncbi:MAG: hypothetical protein Q9221_007695 [Calogaya cf. arnoldii]